MKNKFLIYVVSFVAIALFNIEKLSAQITSESSPGSIQVTSTEGSTTFNAFSFSIIIAAAPNVNENNWSLAVRANPPIINSEGKTIDPSKISIRINQVSGGPSLADLGANQTPIPLNFSYVNIINRSKFKLENKSGAEQYRFDFDIMIEGGIYLKDLKSINQYLLSLTFAVLRSNGRTITESSPQVSILIDPQDVPPEPTYSIEVNSNARNGLLEFKTMRNYVEGVSQTYENGLSVVSTTPYAVQVRSLNTNFEAGTHTLPVSAVSLEIRDPNNSSVGGTIALSENAQTVFPATNPDNNPRIFNIRYFTQPNDERMINAKSDSYETTLMYTLVPQ